MFLRGTTDSATGVRLVRSDATGCADATERVPP